MIVAASSCEPSSSSGHEPSNIIVGCRSEEGDPLLQHHVGSGKNLTMGRKGQASGLFDSFQGDRFLLPIVTLLVEP